MLMNRTILAFILIVIVGLGAVVYISSKSAVKTTAPGDTSLIDTQTVPSIVVPSTSNESPAPTLAPISATKGVIKTARGTIEVVFYPQDAPKTVTNFATLTANRYYDGLTFHRVEPGFVIQGGDPNGNGTGGTSIYGGPFADELNPNTASYKEGYTEGTVAMANSGPNTNGSQFFIMWSDNPNLPRNYTIFGKVTTGMDVVHKMVAGDKILSITVE